MELMHPSRQNTLIHKTNISELFSFFKDHEFEESEEALEAGSGGNDVDAVPIYKTHKNKRREKEV